MQQRPHDIVIPVPAGAPSAAGRFVLDGGRRAETAVSQRAVFLSPAQIPWQNLSPQLGGRSPQVAVLHVDPATGATTLMIRTPPNFHVPRHWHAAGEKHTVISGTFILQCDGGEAVALKPGSFNYMPPRVVHQAWTPPDEDCVLFTDVEGPWDVNWVDRPPWELRQNRGE